MGPVAIASGGIFLGTIFFVTAKRMRQQSHYALARYLIVTGFGIILGYIAISSAVHIIDRIHTPFPPFAMLPWAIAGLAVYLASSGFFYSAVSISQDVNLRKSLKLMALANSNLFESLGSAQMEQEILVRVTKMAKENEDFIKEQTGVQKSVSEEEIKFYLDDVMEEVKKIRNN